MWREDGYMTKKTKGEASRRASEEYDMKKLPKKASESRQTIGWCDVTDNI